MDQKIKVNALLSVYKEEIFNLKNENMILKAYIKQLEEQLQQEKEGEVEKNND